MATAGSASALLAVALIAGGGASTCARTPPHAAGGEAAASVATGAPDPVAPLRDWENTARASRDFARALTSDTVLGTDPYVVRGVVGTPGAAQRFVGVLRGRSALVALNADLDEIDRLPTPPSPSGLALGVDGSIFVVGELSSAIARYRLRGDRLESDGAIALPGVLAMRDVATGPEGLVYAVEEHDGRLLTLAPGLEGANAPPAARVDVKLCHGPFRVQRAPHALLIDCLLDHAIVVRPVDARGWPTAAGEVRIVHDGPMWGFDAIEERNGATLVAVGGVEDHPLDRTEGSFGFIDSFVTLYRVANGKAAKLAEVNTSALGVVTPKVVKVAESASGAIDVHVAGYASTHLATLAWGPGGAGPLGEPFVTMRTIPPGAAMAEALPDGTFVLADPLLDAWVRAAPSATQVHAVDDGLARSRSTESRLGEALFFTTLMAPWDRSDGRLSRFTCETCHWEGYVDGRTHHTGRGDIHATTKPLLGLMSNRPHFSRALDPDMATMVDAEFGVAGAKSGHSPSFTLQTRDFPWLSDLAVEDDELPPALLRRSLMTFLMDFTHRPSPAAWGRTQWTPLEREGAVVFRDRCESCHEARLVTDEPSTRVSFDRWEELTLSPSDAVVWAHDGYERTGVLPYVGEHGARVVSLRRLYKKHPYFTNGTARDLGDVLDRARFSSAGFFHESGPDTARALGPGDKRALSAFLDLL